MVDYSRYAKGEILAFFKKDLFKRGFGERFAEDFLRLKGYQPIDECCILNGDNIIIVKTPVGKEEQYIEQIESYSDVFESVTLRDIRFERRWENLETSKELTRELRDKLGSLEGMINEEYNQEVEKIREYLENIKE